MLAEIPVVHLDPDSGERVLRLMHWNLIPAYIESREKLDAFDAAYSTFNAKIERVTSAPTFRDSWRRQRCLVVVAEELEAIAISKRVNNPRYDAPDCLDAAEPSG